MRVNDQATKDSGKRLSVVLAGLCGDLELATSALSDSDPKVRASALTSLEKLAGLTQGQLSTALEDPDSYVRRRACELCASHPEVNLVDLLDDHEPVVVEMALWALGERQDATLAAKICKVAQNHPQTLVREAAIAALGAIGDEKGLSTILEALHDRPNVRRRAVIALAAFEGDEVENALEIASHDRDWQVRQIAEDLLNITHNSKD